MSSFNSSRTKKYFYHMDNDVSSKETKLNLGQMFIRVLTIDLILHIRASSSKFDVFFDHNFDFFVDHLHIRALSLELLLSIRIALLCSARWLSRPKCWLQSHIIIIWSCALNKLYSTQLFFYTLLSPKPWRYCSKTHLGSTTYSYWRC